MTPLSLFEGYGIELEHMIVDRDSLEVRPLADRVLAAEGGDGRTEVELGDVAWSNELALHVIEMKTNGPSPVLAGVAERFQRQVARMNEILRPLGARLMPTGMHPFMDPYRELRLWPHEDDAIYTALHRIFDCRGHGWANLQSMHVNLPFADDAELSRLHAAVRLVLPILPGLAASSPIADRRATGKADTRLSFYRHNADRVPSVTGAVVPERVYDRVGYQREILDRIYLDMRDLDPEGVLRHEWINARGCIARFDRMALEIRLLDTQECPRADLAIAQAVVATVRELVEERHVGAAEQRDFDEARLARHLWGCVEHGSEAVVEDAEYLRVFGWPGKRASMRELWSFLTEGTAAADPDTASPLSTIASEGCLSRRILQATGGEPSRARLDAVYRHLCECLARGELFHASDV